jgi:hypothetical protein
VNIGADARAVKTTNAVKHSSFPNAGRASRTLVERPESWFGLVVNREPRVQEQPRLGWKVRGVRADLESRVHR